ncbi:MAG: hypothetical protein ACYCZO_10385 [Daejeonella sp.]
MEVHLSDFSQGNIKAYVTGDGEHDFLVDIPGYKLHLTLRHTESEWECIRNSGTYNPVWVKEIAYQVLHPHDK